MNDRELSLRNVLCDGFREVPFYVHGRSITDISLHQIQRCICKLVALVSIDTFQIVFPKTLVSIKQEDRPTILSRIVGEYSSGVSAIDTKFCEVAEHIFRHHLL